MMAVNRYRLRHRAKQGARGAKLALALLAQTDKLLGVILLGNNLINAGAATLAAVITGRLFGEGKLPLALGTLAITFLILVFSEITPKVAGAAHADRLAPLVSFVLAPMLKIATPVVWFVNLFVRGLLKLLRIRPEGEGHAPLTLEELRSLVLEGQYFRGKHRAMLANLLDLDAISVDDVMTPRSQIEAIDLNAKPTLLAQQLANSYHTRLPAYEDELDNIVGIIHVRQVLRLLQADEFDSAQLRTIRVRRFHSGRYSAARTAAAVPGRAPAARARRSTNTASCSAWYRSRTSSRRSSANSRQQAPGGAELFQREPDGSVVVDGMASLRLLNRKLGTAFPLDGPKTLNGLIVDHLGEIPDAGANVRIAGQAMEILQVQDRAVKVVRLLPPVGRSAAPALQTSGEQASSIS